MKCIAYHRYRANEESGTYNSYGDRIDRLYEETSHEGQGHRPALQDMLASINSGDTLIIQSVDRLAVSQQDLLVILQTILRKECSVKFREEDLMFTCTDGQELQLFLKLLSVFVKFEQVRASTTPLSTPSASTSDSKPYSTNPIVADDSTIKNMRASGISLETLQEQFNLSPGAINRLIAA